MKRAIVAIMCVSLGGCAGDVASRQPSFSIATPAPALPQFQSSRFKCPSQKSIPAPPATPSGDYAITRDIAQGHRGDVCESKLESVGRELKADGMVPN